MGKLVSPFHLVGRALIRRQELCNPCFILPLTSPITLSMCLCGHFLSHLLSHLPVQHFRDALTHGMFSSYRNGCAGVWGNDVSHLSTSNSLNILTSSIELKSGEKSKVKDILCKLQFWHFSWNILGNKGEQRLTFIIVKKQSKKIGHFLLSTVWNFLVVQVSKKFLISLCISVWIYNICNLLRIWK